MEKFLDDNFLLQSDFAVQLYHNFAASMPIIDYHCHLEPEKIANNHGFKNLAEIWLSGDHYKWRAMRSNGVKEKFCTGEASDWEKFYAWAETVPQTLRNPLYHWTHMELKKPFGISDTLLDAKSAKSIWENCNQKLQSEDFRAISLIEKAKVKIICTTDDPLSLLKDHQKANSLFADKVRTYPTFRPDQAIAIEGGEQFLDYVDRLSAVCSKKINDLDSFCEALHSRLEFFHEMGCRLSDHGLNTVYAQAHTEEEVAVVLKKALAGETLKDEEVLKFKSLMMLKLGRWYSQKNWVMQLHLGAIRNNNTRMLKSLGPDTGFDSIGDEPIAAPLSRYLDSLDVTDQLPKTILYNLNPRDNELMATMIGNFQDGSVVGKIQYGSGWWFLDQKDGMEKQIEALSNLGLLSRFVGMLTDSRSFLSYSRHEYFRRILCNIFAEDVNKGLIPKDMDLIGQMVSNICFNNAKNYFGLPLPNS